jgi:hypothetical protein
MGHGLLPHSTEMLTYGLRVDWTQEEAEVPGGNAHLWEESWDDDDENEDFSKQLKYTNVSSQRSTRVLTWLGTS